MTKSKDVLNGPFLILSSCTPVFQKRHEFHTVQSPRRSSGARPKKQSVGNRDHRAGDEAITALVAAGKRAGKRLADASHAAELYSY